MKRPFWFQYRVDRFCYAISPRSFATALAALNAAEKTHPGHHIQVRQQVGWYSSDPIVLEGLSGRDE